MKQRKNKNFILSVLIIFSIQIITSDVLAQRAPSRSQVEQELQKAIEAQHAETETTKEKEELIFEINIAEPDKQTQDISIEGKEKAMAKSTSHMRNVMIGFFPGIANFNYEKHYDDKLKNQKRESERYKIDVLPGDVKAAAVYADRAGSTLQKSAALTKTLDSNDKIIDLINVGFSAIKSQGTNITMDDMQFIFDQQIKETKNISTSTNPEDAGLAYYKAISYSFLIECAYVAFKNYQDILRTQIKKNIGIYNNIEYKTQDKSIFISIETIKIRMNDILKRIQLYITLARQGNIFSPTEQSFTTLYETIRYYFIYNNTVKTELFAYKTANIWNFIQESPLIEKTIKISKHTYSQQKIFKQFLSVLTKLFNLYDIDDLDSRQKLLEDTVTEINHTRSEINLFTIKSILNLINPDFSGSGIFTKEYKYITLYNFFNNNIIKYSNMLSRDNTIDMQEILNKQNILIDVDLATKKITTSLTLQEEAITNPFFRYMTDYFLEISIHSDKDYKTAEIKIGITENNKFNGVVLYKTSSIIKPGFHIGFDKKDRSGYTQVLKIKDNLPIEGEFKYFESKNGITYSKELFLECNNDNISYIDPKEKNIVGNGKAQLITIDYSTNKASKHKWLIDNSKQADAK